MFRKAITIKEKVFGTEHPDVATNYRNLGCLLMEKGDKVGAKSCIQRTYDIRYKVFGPTHPEIVDALNALKGFEASGAGANSTPSSAVHGLGDDEAEAMTPTAPQAISRDSVQRAGQHAKGCCFCQ